MRQRPKLTESLFSIFRFFSDSLKKLELMQNAVQIIYFFSPTY